MASTSTTQPSQKCIFCSQGEDEKRYGKMVVGHGLSAHNFCLLFSSGLAQKGDDSEGLLGFLPEDVKKERNRCGGLKCSFCKKGAASIGCFIQRCKRSYHYGCGKDHGSMYLYHDNFRSYCNKHRINQKDLTEEEKTNTTQDDSCIICYEPLTPAISGTTILSPCCTRAWYHRTCLEDMAYSAGLHFFKCPLCNNKDEWQLEMLKAGIYIPDRDASWELEPNAYASLLMTTIECEADECACPKGREEDQNDSIWELILCDSCGSQACHYACGKLKRKDTEWLCKLCSSVVTQQCVENESPLPKPAKRRRAHCPSKAIQEVTNIV